MTPTNPTNTVNTWKFNCTDLNWATITTDRPMDTEMSAWTALHQRQRQRQKGRKGSLLPDATVQETPTEKGVPWPLYGKIRTNCDNVYNYVKAPTWGDEFFFHCFLP